MMQSHAIISNRCQDKPESIRKTQRMTTASATLAVSEVSTVVLLRCRVNQLYFLETDRK